jgi:hypothetical protein
MLGELFGIGSQDSGSLTYQEFLQKVNQASLASFQAFKTVTRVIDYLKLTLPLSHQYEAITKNTTLVISNVISDKFVPLNESEDVRAPRAF